MLEILSSVITVENIFIMFLGTFAGIIFGAIPGLTTVLAVVLFTPMTYGMDSITAILLLLGLYCGGTYGGSITSILINTPGTPAASATAVDGYPLAKKGMAKKALEMALYASVFGGIISGIVLLIGAPAVAAMAIKFGAPEYFMLAVFGLTMIISVSSKDILSGVVAGCIGIFLSIVGTDVTSGVFRYTFGSISLASGIDMLIIMIGMFAVLELMEKASDILRNRKICEVSQEAIHVTRAEKGVNLSELKQCLRTIVRSSFIGTGIGALPGTGAVLASFISYDMAKKRSPRGDNFGKGELEAVAATEAGNNGVTGATLIPMLTLGIPGDNVVAIMLGAFTIHGLTPGPNLFSNSANVVYALMIGFLLLQLVMLVEGKLVLRYAYKVAYISNLLLVPIILLFCTAGSFAVRNKMSDVWMIIIFAFVGFLLKKLQIPTLPMILGYILGAMAEKYFRRALAMSTNGALIFATRPICVVFLLVIVLTVVFTVRQQYKVKKTAAK